MTQEQIEKYRQAAANGSLPTEENPLFLFSKVSTSLLVKALAREFNIMDLIRMQLRERGVNNKGQWIGFDTEKPKKKPGIHKGNTLQ